MGPLARLFSLAAPFFGRRWRGTGRIIDKERGPIDTDCASCFFPRRVRLPKIVGQLHT